MEKYIAYREVDSENDIWSERVFLFKTMEEVNNFFKADNPLLIELYTDEEDREIMNFVSNYTSIITTVTFRTEYAGCVKIVQMHSGYIINSIQ